MSTSLPVSLEFIVGNEPSQLKGDKIQRIKSHVARLSWQGHSVGRRKSRRRRHKAVNATVTYECTPAQDPSPFLSLVGLGNATPPLEYPLGGGRVDPFHAHPGHRKLFIPSLIDHCKQC